MQKLKIPIFYLLLSYEAEQIAILIEFQQIKWICFCLLSHLYTNSANLLSIRVQHLLPFLPQFCSTSSSDFNIDLVGFPPGCHPDSLFLFASSSISSASTIPSAIPVCCTVVHTPTSQVRKNRIMDKKKKMLGKEKTCSSTAIDKRRVQWQREHKKYQVLCRTVELLPRPPPPHDCLPKWKRRPSLMAKTVVEIERERERDEAL